MKQINIHEAKAQLSRLVDQAGNGQRFLITKSGRPLAQLGPLSDQPPRKIKLGLMEGRIRFLPGFDAPLPDDLPEGCKAMDAGAADAIIGL